MADFHKKNNRVLTFRGSLTLKGKLETYAEHGFKSGSDLIRHVLEKYFKETEADFEESFEK